MTVWCTSLNESHPNNPLQVLDCNLIPQKYDARVLLSEPQRSVTLLIMFIGHGLITPTDCFLLNNLYSFKQLLCKQDGCFMSGSTVIFIVGFYVILSLLSDLNHAIELCRENNKYIFFGGGGKGGDDSFTNFISRLSRNSWRKNLLEP